MRRTGARSPLARSRAIVSSLAIVASAPIRTLLGDLRLVCHDCCRQWLNSQPGRLSLASRGSRSPNLLQALDPDKPGRLPFGKAPPGQRRDEEHRLSPYAFAAASAGQSPIDADTHIEPVKDQLLLILRSNAHRRECVVDHVACPCDVVGKKHGEAALQGKGSE